MYIGKQLEKYAVEVLKGIGIEKGQTILDCCCGAGTYTIPAAQLVGKEGLVYAVDVSNGELNDLKQGVNLGRLQNVEIIQEDVELRIPLSDSSVDVVLLYDIFWYFRPTESKLSKLLQEVYRVAKPDALISVYPTHIDSSSLKYFKNEMKNKSFNLESKYSRKIVHEKSIERGELLNFRKVEKSKAD